MGLGITLTWPGKETKDAEINTEVRGLGVKSEKHGDWDKLERGLCSPWQVTAKGKTSKEEERRVTPPR